MLLLADNTPEKQYKRSALTSSLETDRQNQLCRYLLNPQNTPSDRGPVYKWPTALWIFISFQKAASLGECISFTMAAPVKFSLLAVAILAFYCNVHSSPVSFPDGPQSGHTTFQRDEITAAQPSEASDNITPPAPALETGEASEPTVGDLVSGVPQIIESIQNYINTAITSYTSNNTATNQPPAQLNQFLGLVDGFLSATNSFAQEFLQPSAGEESAEPVPAAPEAAVVPVAENNV